MVRASDNEFPSVLFDEQASAPTTPGSQLWRLYFKSDGLYFVEDDGTEHGPVQLPGSLSAQDSIDFNEAAAPASPSAGDVRIYAKTDGLLYSKDDAGTETLVSGGSGGGGGSGATTKRKSLDESVTSSTTLQDDDDLSVAMGANETWVADFVLFTSSPSSSPDIKVNFTIPSGASGQYGADGPVIGLNSVDGNSRYQYAEIGSAAVMAFAVYLDSNAEGLVRVSASVANGATAGDLQLQWAQFSSNANATIVKAGSYMIAHQVA